MSATLRWVGPAALLIGALGCGQEATTTKPAAAVPAPNKEVAPPAASANLVTLKVDGMV